jgi:hypothetical protein
VSLNHRDYLGTASLQTDSGLESWNVVEEAQWVVIHLGFDAMPCWARDSHKLHRAAASHNPAVVGSVDWDSTGLLLSSHYSLLDARENAADGRIETAFMSMVSPLTDFLYPYMDTNAVSDCPGTVCIGLSLKHHNPYHSGWQ